MPIVAELGSNATTKVDRPISMIVTRKVYFRPTISPIRPKKIAPNGRTIKPAAKASNAKIFRVVSSNIGLPSAPSTLKNCAPIIAARDPYR